MTTLPPSGPLATAGASLVSTIVVIDVSPLVVVALGALAAAFSVGALYVPRGQGRARAVSPVGAPRVAMPYAALGEGR